MTQTLPSPPYIGEEWPEQGAWTYDDYARIPDDGRRYEVIRGILYMAPSPNTRHQYAISRLGNALYNYVEQHQLGRIYFSPIDVILPGLANPIQPDILFIARDRLDIIRKQTIDEPPDLVVEVLSPSSRKHDRRLKYETYEAAGVREYWIVDVDQDLIEVFVLRTGQYTKSDRYTAGQTAISEVLNGFSISVDAVCAG